MIIENLSAKGEIAHHEQFIRLSQCFQQLSAAEATEHICLLGKGKNIKLTKSESFTNENICIPVLER